MRLFSCILWCAISWLANLNFLATSAYAHDLGITDFSLTELGQGRYQFARESVKKTAEVIAAPILPAHCKLLELRDLDRKDSFNFDCSAQAGLHAGDVIILPKLASAVMVRSIWLDKRETRAMFLAKNSVIRIAMSDLSAGSNTLYQLAPRYTKFGIVHIATGIDHLFFVLCLMLLVTNTPSLIKAVTAFTVAHSLTLGLAFLEVIKLRSAPVEASIALSIVCLAYEFIRAQAGHICWTTKWPWAVAGGFGLLHGLGFAGALGELGVPRSDLTAALFFFNIGVECGQLLFIAAVMASVLIINRAATAIGVSWLKIAYCKLAGAYAIGSIALYWTIERTALLMPLTTP